MTTWLLVGTVVLGAVALWLPLPRGRKAGRRDRKHRKIVEFHAYDDHWLDHGAEEGEEAELPEDLPAL
jgi:hypothetical protein